MIAEFDMSHLFSECHATLEDLFDLEQDYHELLGRRDSLTYRNCHNLKINIDSKINRLSFINCSNIVVKVSDVITGIEIRRCQEITVKTRKKKPVNSILIRYSGGINLRIPKKMKRMVDLRIERSNNIHVYDLNKKTIEYFN